MTFVNRNGPPTSGGIKPGSHICLLYNTEADHQAAMAIFFRQAIEQNARVIHICDQHPPEALLAELHAVGIDTQPLIAGDRLLFYSAERVFRSDGSLQPKRMLDWLKTRTDEALEAGCNAVYVSTDMSWALYDQSENDLIAYEAYLNQVIHHLPLVILHQYDRRAFAPDLLMNVLQTHPLIMVASEIYENHLYVPPAVFFGQDSGISRFEYLLNELIERKQIEQRLRRSEQMYESLANASPDGILLISPNAYVRYASPKALALFGYQRLEEVFGTPIWDHLIPGDVGRVETRIKDYLKGHLVDDNHFEMIRKDGSHFIGEIDASPFYNEEDRLEGIVAIVRDVTRRVRLEQEQVRAREELSRAEKSERDRRMLAETMRATSEALTHAMSETEVMDTILDTVHRLVPEAFAYLLLVKGDENSPLILYPEGAVQKLLMNRTIPLLTINQVPGLKKMADTRKPVIIDDTVNDPHWVSAEEPVWTHSYAGVPIIIDDRVMGFLSLHGHEPYTFSVKTTQLLESLAGHAALSLQKAHTFSALANANRALEEKNQALIEAYNATIEGWSRALELRDKETQGHSQRVVALTLRLARRLGIPEDEMTYIRWGALLHDIGKMGIPDHILLKAEPLNEDDWQIMKRHPAMAIDMLAGISHLTRALLIPYAHHEFWNGKGYPLGLKGEEIPLPARIFAVIDNWDALLADRPYRKGWSREEVIRYLRQQAGEKFDPNVVEAFVDIIDD